jgi:HK97 family phage portal protein
MFISSIRADSTQDRSVFGDYWFKPFGFTTGMQRVTPATAMGLPVVYSCVKVIAESFAIMPFELYQPKADGRSRTLVRKHWLWRLFRKSPNRFQTPFEWRLMLMGHLALRGNAYCQITATSRGEITELLPLHPDRMCVELEKDAEGGVTGYHYKYTDQNGREIRYTRGEIWHLRGMSDDGYMGLSPIALAREAIGEGLAIQSYSSRFFANDARPGGGWIEMAAGTTFGSKEKKLDFRESWQQMQGGVNRGKVAVLEGGMKYHELGLNNRDSQFIEARAAKKSEIAAIWRVPPHKIADLTDATYSNIEQQSIEFWTDCMLPWAELWESSIEYFLVGPDHPQDLECEFDMRRMMRGDSTARGNYYKNGIFAGWLTRNEARVEEGYDPLPGLDEPLTPLNMVEEASANDGPPSSQNKKKPAGGGEQEEDEDEKKPQRGKERREQLAATAQAAQARMEALVHTNAARMARRLAGNSGASASMLADALAIPVTTAEAWLQQDRTGHTEDQLTASLVALGEQP